MNNLNEQILWTSANGKWTIDKWYKGTIERMSVSDGWLCYYPIRYDDGRIAYDTPEAIPAYVKEAVKKMYDKHFSR